MWQATSADIVIVVGDPDGDVGRFAPERFGPRGGHLSIGFAQEAKSKKPRDVSKLLRLTGR